jgi:cytochrome P450
MMMILLPSYLPSAASLCSCLILVLLVHIVKSYILWYFSPLHKIPGAKASFFSGCFREINKEPFMDPHRRWWKKAGVDAPLLHYTSLMGSHSLVILDKELVRTILTAPVGKDKKERFRKDPSYMKSRLGDGLVTLQGPDWRRHRRIIQPSFHTQFLKERLDTVVPPLVAQLLEYWKTVPAGSEIDVAVHISALTLDVVGIVLFSHEFQGLRAVEAWATDLNPASDPKKKNDNFKDPFIQGLMLQSFQFNLLTVLLLAFGLIFLDPYINPLVRRSTRLLNDAVDQVIAHAAERHTAADNTPQSLLHLLLQQTQQDGLNLVELRDETKTFLIAGHETTSTWIYWTLFALAQHPDVQERLYQSIILKEKNKDKDKDKNDYLSAVLQEVLRLYPPVGMTTRISSYPETFAGYHIPANTRLVVSMFLLHRHPLYWDDPETFRPERWLNVSDDEWERRRFAFLPFLAGGRNCIGQRFATIEAELVVAPIVRAFSIQMAPSQRDVSHTFTNSITLKAKPALKIIVQPRV